MMADLIAAGDQCGYADLRSKTRPVTWGQAMDVPDSKFHSTDRLSTSYPEGEDLGDQAANMFTPGALMSGFRNSGEMELGPLDE